MRLTLSDIKMVLLLVALGCASCVCVYCVCVCCVCVRVCVCVVCVCVCVLTQVYGVDSEQFQDVIVVGGAKVCIF